MKSHEPEADPFLEARAPRYQVEFCVLGGRFRFESDSRELLSFAHAAYAGLPVHAFAGSPQQFVVRLFLGEPLARRRAAAEPPPVQPLGVGGLLAGAVNGASFVTVDPAAGSAIVVIARSLLYFPYHVRYELLEFAVYCLAARAQRLVPLHAACLGRGGGGALVLGASGAGKSTLMLHALQAGFEFVAEDSVLVRPKGLLATGVANFLHLRTDSRHLAQGTPLESKVRRSAVIQRRSGIRKYELDLRRREFHLARAPLRLRTLVFLSAQRGLAGELLVSLPAQVALQRLRAGQRYAARQQGWSDFLERARHLPAFELRRGPSPVDGVAELDRLLQRLQRRPRTPRR